MMTGKVDDKYLLSFRGRETALPGVSKVYNEAKTLKRYTLEKATRPDLVLKYFNTV